MVLTCDPQSYGYQVQMLDTFLLTLFDKYAELLKRRFSDDFQEVRGHPLFPPAPYRLNDPDCFDG